jgi:hypothetical protein
MVELQGFASFDLIILLPLVGGPITAGVEEAVEDCQEDGPLDGELLAATLEKLSHHVSAAGLLPELLKDQRGTNATAGVGWELPLGMVSQHEERLRQAGTGEEQGLELTALLELVESSQRGHNAL